MISPTLLTVALLGYLLFGSIVCEFAIKYIRIIRMHSGKVSQKLRAGTLLFGLFMNSLSLSPSIFMSMWLVPLDFKTGGAIIYAIRAYG